ncbi:TPA: hypothetical protein P0O11_000507 [Yersinia enterocolitica]|nr:hypothetical protein [Yersinia enterocolitica]
MSLRSQIIAFLILVLLAIGYGEIRYRNGWYAHSDQMNAAAAKRQKKAEAKLEPIEQKAATAKDDGKVIYKTITRDVVKYVQDPNHTRCDFDATAIRLRQQSIDAANNIAGFDDTTVQAKSSGR